MFNQVVPAARYSSLHHMHGAVILFAASHGSLWRLAGASPHARSMGFSLKFLYASSLELLCLGAANRQENATVIAFSTKRMLRFLSLSGPRLEVWRKLERVFTEQLGSLRCF